MAGVKTAPNTVIYQIYGNENPPYDCVGSDAIDLFG